MTDNARDLDTRVLERGRDVVLRLTAVLRACGLYESDNTGLRAASDALRVALASALDGGVELELAVRGESLYIGGTRLRESVVASVAYQRVVDTLRRAKVRALRIDEAATSQELESFARLLVETAHGKRRPEDFAPELALRAASVSVEVGAELSESVRDDSPELVAKRVYLRSISVVKNVFHSIRLGDQMAARRVKRVVQEMIESLDNDPGYLINLSSLKNYDEYTFNHSVNTSVLAISLGRHIGLERRQLYTLGQAGMLHDLGKLCLPIELLNKPTRLSAEERAVVELHSTDGFVSIATQMGVGPETLDVALTAYEHHITESGEGYPKRPETRRKRLLSRIVSIVDCYDAMTSARVYRGEPIPPPETLAHMFGSGRGDFDPLLLRSFMNLMGILPIGTAVMLSDGCVGFVIGGNPDAELRHFPSVRVVIDADGHRRPPLVVDLAATAKDADPLRVVEVVSAARFGISTLETLI